MTVTSAGILLYRIAPDLQVFLGHMGGPFWARKDAAAWSIPKGIVEADESPLDTGLREFGEEIGTPPPPVDYHHLGDFRQSSGKVIVVFAANHDLQIDRVVSNTFTLEWPPRSGRLREFPEIDDARWFGMTDARIKLVAGQRAILDALEELVTGEDASQIG